MQLQSVLTPWPVPRFRPLLLSDSHGLLNRPRFQDPKLVSSTGLVFLLAPRWSPLPRRRWPLRKEKRLALIAKRTSHKVDPSVCQYIRTTWEKGEPQTSLAWSILFASARALCWCRRTSRPSTEPAGSCLWFSNLEVIACFLATSLRGANYDGGLNTFTVANH